MKQRRKSISSVEDSPANQFRQRVNGKLKPIRVGSGQSSPVSSVYFDPATSLWKTSQDSLLKGWDSSSLTFPRWGTMRDGVVCRQQTLEPHTSETESSLLPTPIRDVMWPTPQQTYDGRTEKAWMAAKKRAANRHRSGQYAKGTGPPGMMDLQRAVRQWRTPQAGDGSHNHCDAPAHKRGTVPLMLTVQVQRLENKTGGKLNPTWVEWLMGFPLGWTDLGDSAMLSSLK
jgi:hypothetical protein